MDDSIPCLSRSLVFVCISSGECFQSVHLDWKEHVFVVCLLCACLIKYIFLALSHLRRLSYQISVGDIHTTLFWSFCLPLSVQRAPSVDPIPFSVLISHDTLLSSCQIGLLSIHHPLGFNGRLLLRSAVVLSFYSLWMPLSGPAHDSGVQYVG